jgi:hypothetical protein
MQYQYYDNIIKALDGYWHKLEIRFSQEYLNNKSYFSVLGDDDEVLASGLVHRDKEIIPFSKMDLFCDRAFDKNIVIHVRGEALKFIRVDLNLGKDSNFSTVYIPAMRDEFYK